MKICVYAIAKNEIKFIERWFNSVKEADYVCCLDTGSTDGTFEKLQSLGVICEQRIYEQFRFDIARNDSMKLIPTDADICVCIDLDEEFEKGWSKILKDNWKNSTTRARYRYTWNFNSDGSEGIVFLLDKIHKKDCYIWKNPVHEVLSPINIIENTLTLPTIQLNHHADQTKSRSSYLPLLELAVKEDTMNDRNMHYLGREYYFNRQFDNAIFTLKKHLSLPTSTWKEERSASMRYIAKCYAEKNNTKKQEEFLLKSVLETSFIREPYFDLAVFYFNKSNYLKSAIWFEEMLKIKTRQLNYMSSPECWSSLPYDYLSLCYYHLNNINKAIENVEIAIKLNPEIRLKNNLLFFKNKLNQ